MASLRTFVSPQTAAALAAARTSTLNTVVRAARPKSTGVSSAGTTSRTTSAKFPSRITSGATRMTSGVFCGTQVRFAHIQPPSFDAYKVEAPSKDPQEADYSRRAFTYLLGAGGAVAGIHLAKSLVQDFLDTMSASVRAQPWSFYFFGGEGRWLKRRTVTHTHERQKERARERERDCRDEGHS